MEIFIVLIIIVIVCLTAYALSRGKRSTPIVAVTPVEVVCPQCDSHDFRFLWDKRIVADNKRLEAVPSGYSNQTGQYSGHSSGSSHGFSIGLGGNPRVNHSWGSGFYSGSFSSHSERYKYKEVSVKTFQISCKCKHCGAVWQVIVPEDEYPEIKKIPIVD